MVLIAHDQLPAEKNQNSCNANSTTGYFAKIFNDSFFGRIKAIKGSQPLESVVNHGHEKTGTK